MFNNDNSSFFKPLKLIPIKIKAIHIPIDNIHSILCTFYVTCLVDLYFKGYIFAIFYHLHEPVYSRARELIHLLVTIIMAHHVLITHPTVTSRHSQSIYLMPLTCTQIYRVKELIFLIVLLMLL